MAITLVGKANIDGYWLPVYETDVVYNNEATSPQTYTMTIPNASDIWLSYFTGDILELLATLPEMSGPYFEEREPLERKFLGNDSNSFIALQNAYNGYRAVHQYQQTSVTVGVFENVFRERRTDLNNREKYSIGMFSGNTFTDQVCLVRALVNNVVKIALFGVGAEYYIRDDNDGRTDKFFMRLVKTAFIGTITYPLNTFFNLEGSGIEILPVDYSPNPFDPVPPSGPLVPGGTFDPNSDIIADSSLPSLSSADTGFTRIYNPTLSQIQDLARYLWTDESVITTIWNHIKQFFENPMEAIIGFNLVPVPVPDGGIKSFALMYIDTGVEMNTAANQFVDQDCGTFKIELYYGSALDYSPYTKISCFLPYIGMVQLNTDEVMGKTLQVIYRVDIASGSCVAKILVDGTVFYQYSGHCAITIPISSADFSSYVSAAIGVAKLAVGAATGGAAGVAMAASGLGTPVQQTNIGFTPPATQEGGSIVPVSGGSLGPITAQPVLNSPVPSTGASFAGMSPENLANTVAEVAGSKPHVQHSGSFSGNSGYLGVRRPFLIIERPNLCLPANYQELNGFPAMITMTLGECRGYTKIQQVQLTGLTATNPEQAEILQLLKGGVIF